eukprot:7736006-Karenia_brevis.AAC.1
MSCVYRLYCGAPGRQPIALIMEIWVCYLERISNVGHGYAKMAKGGSINAWPGACGTDSASVFC